ncbi:MAG: hypothetical protein IKJ10_03570 [Bacteroidaceae bacterium]|nr:hypothetical protein [Bacteroidaceae bacterium]
MNKDKLECLAKQAIERTIACLASFNLEKSFVEQSVYSDEGEFDGNRFQVGFHILHEKGKPFRIGPSVCDEDGVAVKYGMYRQADLKMDSDFVSALMDEYIHLMKEARISVRDEREFDRSFYSARNRYDTTGKSDVPSLPFVCSVTDDLYQRLDIEKNEMRRAVQRLVKHFLENRDRYIRMQNIYWRVITCVLTRASAYEIGVRIRYDAQERGGFCPICRDEKGIYWQMETCSFFYLKDDAEFVECLADYYVFVLALQRGLLSAGDEPIEKYSRENLTEGVWGRKLLYI